MNKNVYIFVLVFLVGFSGIVFAKQRTYDITEEYGPKLDRVSFKERYLFNKTYNIDWYQSTLEQRKEFLEQYHADVVEDAKQKAEYRKRVAAKLKEEAKVKKERLLKEKIQKREQAMEARIEKIEEAREENESKDRHKRLIKGIESLHKTERKN